MLLDDLTDYLSSQGGWTNGTNLFAGVSPTKPDACLTIYEAPGLAAVHGMHGSAGQAKEENPAIQVVARAGAEDYAAARVEAHKAWKLLDGLPTRAINGVAYKWGMARQSPFLMGRDAQGRVLVAFNVDIAKELSTTS